MKRTSIRKWLLCGALGASFLAGCNQVDIMPPQDRPVATVMARPSLAPKVTTYQAVPVAVRTPPVAPAPVTFETEPLLPAQAGASLGTPKDLNNGEGVPVTVAAAPARVVPDTRTVPVVTMGFEPSAEVQQTTAPSPAPAPSPVAPAPVPAKLEVLFPRGETVPVRKSYVDLTAAPCFSHAPDYNWIIGQVEYSRIAKEWRLRYASVDEIDEHGGRVILIENHHVSLLRDGQFVHVRGHLADGGDSTETGPAHYRIESFKTLTDCNAQEPEHTAK